MRDITLAALILVNTLLGSFSTLVLNFDLTLHWDPNKLFRHPFPVTFFLRMTTNPRFMQVILNYCDSRYIVALEISSSIFHRLKDFHVYFFAACVPYRINFPQRYNLFEDRTKTIRVIPCRAFLLPLNLTNVGRRRLWEQKQFLAGKGIIKCLINKLIKNEWVGVVRLPPKAHGMS